MARSASTRAICGRRQARAHQGFASTRKSLALCTQGPPSLDGDMQQVGRWPFHQCIAAQPPSTSASSPRWSLWLANTLGLNNPPQSLPFIRHALLRSTRQALVRPATLISNNRLLCPFTYYPPSTCHSRPSNSKSWPQLKLLPGCQVCLPNLPSTSAILACPSQSVLKSNHADLILQRPTCAQEALCGLDEAPSKPQAIVIGIAQRKEKWQRAARQGEERRSQKQSISGVRLHRHQCARSLVLLNAHHTAV